MNIASIYRNSFFFSLVIRKPYEIILSSFTYKILNKLFKVFANAFNLSLTKRLFLTDEGFFDRFFNNSFIEIATRKLFFGLTEVIINFTKNLFSNSLIQTGFSSIKKDLDKNVIKYASFFFLCWIIVYAILELIIGSGFTKSEMLVYIFLVIILLIFTRIEIGTDKIIKRSFIIKWIKELFN